MPSIVFGFSLIEVLISLLLLAFAILGLDAIEVVALRDNRAAYFSMVAINQIQVMTNRLRVLREHAEFEQQVAQWNQENQLVLPQGRGIVLGNFPAYTLTINWGDKAHQSCAQIQLGQSGCIKKQIAFVE